jgi:hypothetical protein
MAAVALVSLAALAAGRGAPRPGLQLSARFTDASGAPVDVVRTVRGVDVRDLHGDPRLRRGPVAAHWTGFWHAREAGSHRFFVESDGAVRVSVDGATVLAAVGTRARAEVSLADGPHAIVVDYESRITPRQLRVQWARADGDRQDFEPPWVFASAPSGGEPARAVLARGLGRAAVAIAMAGALALAFVARARPWVKVALPAAVVLYAGALRFEALVARYSWQGPAWALRAERVLSELRPAALRWLPGDEEYSGDPLTYLRRARVMSGPWQADVREPLFPLAAKALLPVVQDRPLAVNAASAAFSTLLVLATFLLGVAAVGRLAPGVDPGAGALGAGLAAALALAVDRDAIWWGVEGFRDDAFALFTVLFAIALLRVRERPGPARAALAGFCAGAACLTRITAFSFLLPALAFLSLGRGREARARRKAAALCLAVTLAVAGPYMAACAVTYGDPFYAVNFHTKFYRSRSGLEHEAPMSWASYLRTGFGGAELVATGLQGVTAYPFMNKWQGLDWWTPWLRRLLAPAAVAGLVLFTRGGRGRLLLVVLFTSLLPYAFTWGVPGGAEWRFTLHAYPFYLVAATSALAWAATRLGGGRRSAAQAAAEGHQQQLVQDEAREAGAAAPADAPPLGQLGAEGGGAGLGAGVQAELGEHLVQEHEAAAAQRQAQEPVPIAREAQPGVEPVPALEHRPPPHERGMGRDEVVAAQRVDREGGLRARPAPGGAPLGVDVAEAAVHHVRVGRGHQRAHGRRDRAGRHVPVVGVLVREHVAAGQGEAAVYGIVHPVIGPALPTHAALAQQVQRAVGGAAVHHHVLDVRIVLGADAGQQLGQEADAVEHRGHDADQGPGGFLHCPKSSPPPA